MMGGIANALTTSMADISGGSDITMLDRPELIQVSIIFGS